jgi:hypothetical protein
VILTPVGVNADVHPYLISSDGGGGFLASSESGKASKRFAASELRALFIAKQRLKLLILAIAGEAFWDWLAFPDGSA